MTWITWRTDDWTTLYNGAKMTTTTGTIEITRPVAKWEYRNLFGGKSKSIWMLPPIQMTIKENPLSELQDEHAIRKLFPEAYK